MVYNREEAAKRAEKSTTNIKGYCQKWTREIFGAPSVGDVDRDGDADAVDGWKSEKKRHEGDRNPPRGTPVSYSGGKNGFGHRAVSLGNGKIRSTDAGGDGKVATVDLDWPERKWGMKYLGWSEDISGIVIPKPPAPEKTSRGFRVDHAIADLKAAKPGNPTRAKLIKTALEALLKIPKTQ